MNNEHFEKVQGIVVESNRLAKDLAEKLGNDDAIDVVFRESNKLWNEQFPKSKGWGIKLHLDLCEADFSGALFACGVGSMEGTDFRNAKLDRTRWLSVQLNKVNFRNASLRNSNFVMCWGSGTNFSGSDLNHSNINISSIEETDFTEADLRNAELTLGMINPAVPTFFHSSKFLLTGANMEGCRVGVYNNRDKSVSERTRSEQLYTFLQSLSEEQKRQVILLEPSLHPVQPSKCFIATAVYGSVMSPQVQLLQQFKQDYLQPRPLGRLFIYVYYRLSPSLAEWIQKHTKVRIVTQYILDFLLTVLPKQHKSKI